MADDKVLRHSLVCVGAIVVLIGIYTYSFKKMLVTYVFGLFAVSGILLPDWEYFDRDVSQWVYPMPADRNSANRPGSTRFKIYPVRSILYTAVYSFSLYKWWNYVFRQ